MLQKIPKCFSILLILFLFFLPETNSKTKILPFEDVKAGMKGTGKTVFDGTKVEEFQVEILGTLENIGPKQNIILAKLSGGPLEKTGVMSGMSGSPIYIDGKLVGALSFMWGFSKEPIAGITPIGEMKQIEKKEFHSASTYHGPWLKASEKRLSNIFQPEKLSSIFQQSLAPQENALSKFHPIGFPLVASGFSQGYLPELRKAFSGDLFTPILIGGASHGKVSESIRIEPGSAIAAQLIKGDISLSLIGTVTDVDGDKVLAFGHPLFNLGKIDMPMAVSRVETLFPSLASSFKIASPLNEIGAFTQDRSSGALGLLNVKSNTVPVRIKLFSNGRESESYSFDIIEDKILTPLLLYQSLNGVLSSAEKQYGDSTIGIKEGSTIKLSEGKNINLKNLFSGDYSRIISTATIAFITYFIMDNEFAESRIEGINLLFDFLDGKKLARIERVQSNRSHVKPGDKIRISITVKPHRAKEFTEVRELEIPEELPPGELTLHVSNAYILSRREAQDVMLVPRDFDHLIQLINNLRTNNKIYLHFTQKDTGLFMQGVRFPNLPLSKSSIMIQPQTRGNYTILNERGVMEESIETEYVIEGYKKIVFNVEEK